MRIAVAGATGNVGRHVTESATARGHDILTLTRRAGYDLEKGTGLAGALDGVDAVIDVANVTSTSAKRSRGNISQASIPSESGCTSTSDRPVG